MTAECKPVAVQLSNEIFPYVTAPLFFSRLNSEIPFTGKSSFVQESRFTQRREFRAGANGLHTHRNERIIKPISRLYVTKKRRIARRTEDIREVSKSRRFLRKRHTATLTMFIRAKLSLGHGQRSVTCAFTCADITVARHNIRATLKFQTLRDK